MSWRDRIDPAFGGIADNVRGYLDIAGGELRDEEAGFAMEVEELSVETPIELAIRVGPDGRVELGCAPPLYRVAVSVEPVFHVLRLRAVAERAP